MEPVFEFPIDFDQAAPHGRTRLLHRCLRSAILDRRLPAGTRLPSTRRVAAAYGVARNTVVAAYDLLVAEGYALARPGARTVVAELGTRHLPATRRPPPLEERRLNPQWRLPAWTTTPFVAAPSTSGFHLGIPEHRHFPLDVWRRLLARALGPRLPAAFGYQDPNGSPLLRTAIARHVSFTRAVACDADDVVVTSGAQQAFDLLARVLVTPGRTRVAVEDPGYLPLRATMAAAGAQLVPVPVDDQGLCVDRIPGDVGIVYVTPSHQFPTGVAMSMPRRAALLAFARAHGAVVIEDDYDSEFRYGQRPLDALQTLDRDASVFYVGTFSKSLFPSLRIGYAIVPAWAREALAAVKQCADTAGNAQLQDALGRFILDGHLARHVRRMRRIYAGRRRAMLEAFEGVLAPWLHPIRSEAGIHLAVRYRDPRQSGRVAAALRRHAPGAQPLSDFTAAAGTDLGAVFGFGCIDEGDIHDALGDLAGALGGRSALPGKRQQG